jgi:hypothetical protein
MEVRRARRGHPAGRPRTSPESRAAAGASTAAAKTAAPSAAQRSHRDHRRTAGPPVRRAAMPATVTSTDAAITSTSNIVGISAGQAFSRGSRTRSCHRPALIRCVGGEVPVEQIPATGWSLSLIVEHFNRSRTRPATSPPASADHTLTPHVLVLLDQVAANPRAPVAALLAAKDAWISTSASPRMCRPAGAEPTCRH